MNGETLAPLLISALIFSLVLLALVGVALLARTLLGLTGLASITINGTPAFEAPYGEKLMSALVEHDIFLPAACGGKGTCGQCRVKILAGANPISAVEAVHIGRSQAMKGERLACLQTIRRPVSIHVPESILRTSRKTFRVVDNRLVSDFLTELELAPVEDRPLSIQAGDYVLLEAPPYRLTFSDLPIPEPRRSRWQKLGLLSLESNNAETTVRGYSIANAPAESTTIRLLVRIATPPPDAPADTPPGIVSSYIFSLKAGDTVTLTAPFGEFHLKESDREMMFIGGGSGMAPLRSMIREELLSRQTARPLSFWYGARDQHQLCYQEEFESLAEQHPRFQFHVALSEPLSDEPWDGPVGFIHRIVEEQYLADHPDPRAIDYYLCGPPLMITAVRTMLHALGVDDRQIYVDYFGD